MIDLEALIRLQEASFARAQGGLRSSWPRDSGMDAEQLRSFLDGHRYCVLATTNAQLHPVARPVASCGCPRRCGGCRGRSPGCAERQFERKSAEHCVVDAGVA